MTEPTFEHCARLYWNAAPDRQRVALRVWHDTLTGSTDRKPQKKRISLKAAAAEIGRHPSVLWRLGVVTSCGESYGGGRKVYDPDEIVAYLKSPACTAKREEISAARRKRQDPISDKARKVKYLTKSRK